MSAAEAIVPNPEVLGIGQTFEGKTIIGIGTEIPGIAGGLRDAMRFSPVAFGEGEPFTLVLTGVCQKIRFDPDDKKDPGGDQLRVQILDAQEGLFIDQSIVKDVLAAHRKLIEAGKIAEEEAKGISRLSFSDDEATMGEAHARGEHSEFLEDGCPVCALEEAAMQAEAAADGQSVEPTPIGSGKKKDGPTSDA